MFYLFSITSITIVMLGRSKYDNLNAKVFKLSSTNLTNCVGFVNSPLDFMKMLPYGNFQKSRAGLRLGASNCSHFVAAQT